MTLLSGVKSFLKFPMLGRHWSLARVRCHQGCGESLDPTMDPGMATERFPDLSQVIYPILYKHSESRTPRLLSCVEFLNKANTTKWITFKWPVFIGTENLPEAFCIRCSWSKSIKLTGFSHSFGQWDGWQVPWISRENRIGRDPKEQMKHEEII